MTPRDRSFNYNVIKGYVMSPTRSPVQRPGDRAWLMSRPFNVTSGRVDMRCLTFWSAIISKILIELGLIKFDLILNRYLMNEPIIDPSGPSLGSLRVYVRKEDTFSGLSLMGQLNVIWRLQNHQGGVWKMGRALITQTSNYRVSNKKNIESLHYYYCY